MVGLPHCSAETLSALLDGELSADERARAREHLDSCLDCGARLVAARRLDAHLRDAGRLSCASILPSLSAIADDEGTPGERALAAAHLADCPGCRLASVDLRGADRRLAMLPSVAPSARVDAFIVNLVHPQARPAFRPVPFAFRTAGALALAVLIAIGSTLLQAAPPSADRARSDEVAMVAAIQHVVFDSRTNTLYLLDTERAEVSAVDATTQSERARVSVGGRPTALALSAPTNRVLVLDATSKRLTEIDTSSHTIVATSTLVVTGTPTSFQVDPSSGKIVVASVSAPAANATPAVAASAAFATGHVTVIDPVSKQVESVRAVDVAPQLVVLDAKGSQALLLSARETTLVDAVSYKSIDALPGGVAAAFDVTGTQVAVLSADGSASKVTFRGAGLPPSLALPGRPVTLIGMPGGGFAALVDRGTGGEVDVIDATGRLVSSSSVTLAGQSVTYDPVTARFAVGGDGGVGLAFSGASAAAVAAPATSAPPTQPVTTAPAASATPKASPAAPSPSASVPVVGPPGLPPAARLAVNGTYRLGMPDNRRPVLVVGAGRTLWFLDEAKRLATIDTATGAVVDVAQLPVDGTFTRLLLGAGHLYAIDQGRGRLAIVTINSGQLELIGFPFVTSAAGFAVGADDALWMAGGDSTNVLSLDPGTKRVAAINFRASSITALYVDSASRVWYADDATGGIGYYDQTTHAIVSVGAPRHATVTALAMDRDGTLWVGTAAGELLSVRLGVPALVATAGGPVAGLVRDGSGAVWSYAPAPGTVTYRSLTDAAGARIAAVPASDIAFDGQGRAWLAVPADTAFHIALNEGR
ncbi:MAG: zf-HC2 domain-containing protein [Chloroflexota bacterium]|nr:zf-HC2 domain-containing protein [Chloroflexota bacterium]